MLEVNLPDVLKEVSEAFDVYERALQANDIAHLNMLFWDSPHTIRYGVKEHLYSHAEIAKFRIDRGPVDQRRQLRNPRITTFGRDFALTNVEYIPEGATRVGRQSQVWVRTDEGWKIVAAHVSYAVG
jgi:hypothetical protein